ncbi:MAG: ATP-dependent 6-phosphofructokinase, partial [Clostridia bacterium]|nr:ATP-dependent 6-phosphofructokinase [Clostridia bacterium]
GSPTCKDRFYASMMGAYAADLLCQGKSNRVVGYLHGEYVDFDIDEALAMQKDIPAYQYEVSRLLSI